MFLLQITEKLSLLWVLAYWTQAIPNENNGNADQLGHELAPDNLTQPIASATQ